MRRFGKELENNIQQRYGLMDAEWVQVDVTNRGKVHVILVTEDNKITREDLRNYVKKELDAYAEYTIGFVDLYSVKQAEELQIQKMQKKASYFSWADTLHAEEKIVGNNGTPQIISFYSYKGGVGRTIALIETAYNLAKEGKRVLLLDLDIEAPSLHTIFSENIKDSINGVRGGIIDYLFRTVIQNEELGELNERYCSLNIENVEGEIFVIPALKMMNKEYIYQISRLQTKKIQERDIFQRIFNQLQEELQLDMILIDTRAGFNAWGSLSLLSLCNQVIFIAYPNAENIEGLNMMTELLENIGKTKYAVAMSKVVASEDGIEKAKNLFKELKINQKEVITIFYKAEIAISGKYPMIGNGIPESYQEISDYILENVRIEENKKFFLSINRKRFAKELFSNRTKLLKLQNVIRFTGLRGSGILRYGYKEQLFGIQPDSMIVHHRIEDGWIPVAHYLLYSEEICNDDIAEMYSGEEISKLAVNMVVRYLKKMNLKTRFDSAKIHYCMTLEELKDAFMYQEIIENRLNDGKEDTQNRKVQAQIQIIVNLTQDLMKKNPNQVIENVKKLLLTFNKEHPVLCIKFLLQFDIWQTYQEQFSVLKGSITELQMEKQDILHMFFDNMNINTLREYGVIWESIDDDMHYRKLKNLMQEQGQLFHIFELLFGVRKEIERYSISVLEDMLSYMNNHKTVGYHALLQEVKNYVIMLSGNGEQPVDRIISFQKLKEIMNHIEEKN